MRIRPKQIHEIQEVAIECPRLHRHFIIEPERSELVASRFVECVDDLLRRNGGPKHVPMSAAAWKQVVALSPDSSEGQAAKRALDGIAAAGHGGASGPGS